MNSRKTKLNEHATSMESATNVYEILMRKSEWYRCLRRVNL